MDYFIPIFENVTERNLHFFFEALSTSEIEDNCSGTIFNRGLDYFESELVSHVFFNADKTCISAIAKGTSNYDIKIQLKKGSISGSCSCPFDNGICKHIVAVLIFCTDCPEGIEIAPEIDKEGHIRQYLNSMSKEQLIELVINFAPQSFFTLLNNKAANQSQAKKTFKKVENAIRKLFSDDELLYDPSGMEAALVSKINLLKGLETQLKDELEELIFYIIKEVDSAIDGGYLYEDDYRSDYMFISPDEFDSFVEGYVSILTMNETYLFLIALDEILKNQSYDIFGHLLKMSISSFNPDEIKNLRSLVMKDYRDFSPELTEQFYLILKSILTNDEKELLLNKILNQQQSYVTEMAELYVMEGNQEKAISFLKKWLEVKGNAFGSDKIFMFYLNLLKNDRQKLKTASKEAIRICGSADLLKAISKLLPGESEEFELALEKESPTELLKYLQNEKRLTEGLALIKRSNNISEFSVYDFFKKHKLIFPQESETFFLKIINKNLQNTGDRYYQEIADALQHIKKINPLTSSRLATEIRFNYKRRTNLIKLISEY